MHPGPARREPPASPAPFMRVAAIETPLSNLIVSRKCFDSCGDRAFLATLRHALQMGPAPPSRKRIVRQFASRLFALCWPPRGGGLLTLA
jgi:hypothetical protein